MGSIHKRKYRIQKGSIEREIKKAAFKRVSGYGHLKIEALVFVGMARRNTRRWENMCSDRR